MWSNEFWQGCQEHAQGQGEFFQQMVLGKVDIPMQNDEVGWTLTLHHILKMDFFKNLKELKS